MSIDYLANKNAHERDSHVSFDEGPHIYTVDGDDSFMSVTTWNHSHFEEFNHSNFDWPNYFACRSLHFHQFLSPSSFASLILAPR